MQPRDTIRCRMPTPAIVDRGDEQQAIVDRVWTGRMQPQVGCCGRLSAPRGGCCGGMGATRGGCCVELGDIGEKIYSRFCGTEGGVLR